MKTSPAGIALIKRFEGLHDKGSDGRIHAYLCPAGIPTIGWGTTDGVVMGHSCTEAEAEELLKRGLGWREERLIELIDVDVSQEQFDALMSWTYNVGLEAARKSTLLKVLNRGDYAAVPAQLMRWTKATVKGKRIDLPGLVARRQAEAALWLSPPATALVGRMAQKVEESPTVEAPRATTFKRSATVFGILMSGLGWVVTMTQEAVQIATSALSEIGILQPIADVMGRVGIDVPTIGVGLGVTGLAIALFRKLDDSAKGKPA